MTAMSNRIRLLYQLVSPLHRTAGPAEVARRLEMLRDWAPGLEVDIASPSEGPPAVESAADIAMVFPALKDAALGWRDDGYDAVLIGCFSDPATEALQEISGLPVFGPGEAALLEAAAIGDRFSVLSSDPTPPGLRRRIRGMGLEPMFLSEVLVGGTVRDLVREPDRYLPAIVAQARTCRSEGADVLVLGCLAMSFAPGLPDRLGAAAGIPVINPVVAGLRAAEAQLAPRGEAIRERAPVGVRPETPRGDITP
ncbi:aspartate/glutamate racemase family protein [Prosthecomicrobium hirschii]|uniref:aspartate/glutamate racemase family protein n=1 Tax=Prosthecodimorpha hirschii TaxID=665126 RepID=UPI0022210ACF|nr:aspartate/glutamate racemase family protein [Prosthecomicrobium hirschii]MCW1842323.1 aspartate/glutamate racemase family protein [Prosthecomicrobium hirschii]